MDDVTIEQARAAKVQVERRASDMKGVTGIGLTRVGRDWAVKVNLEDMPADGSGLPDRIGTVHVVVEVTGPIRARKR